MKLLSSQKGVGVIGVILILIVLGGIGFAGWKMYESRQQNEDQAAVETQAREVVTDLDLQRINEIAQARCDLSHGPQYIGDENPNEFSPKEEGFVKEGILFSNDGLFARASISCAIPGGGGEALEMTLKKIDGQWTLIHYAPDTPAKAWGQQHNAPKGWYTTVY